jgi:site-specific recombinase XerD
MNALRKQMIQQMQLKGYSHVTIKSYVSIIARMALFYKTPADILTVDQIRDYILLNITENKRSKSWINMTISAVKILFCEVLKRQWNRLDIPRVRREIKRPTVLSKDEVRRIIGSKKNIKHRAILMLTYSSGLRLGEVSTLKIGDIDSSRMLIHLKRAKGNKERYTILSPVALDLLRKYYRIYKPKEWLFEGRSSRNAISKSTVQEVFKQALEKSNVHKKVGIHSLRHSFATHLLEQGVALPIIQQMLGHQSLRTTSGYLHVQQYSIQGVKSPLDSLSF